MSHRLSSAALGLAAAVCLAGAGDPTDSKGLAIYFIDVQGGAATLVVTPEKESLLIDSGWPGNDDRDPQRIVQVLKEVAGCDHLDHLLTTHWHVDHVGGVEGLAKRIDIRHYWDRGLPEDKLPNVDFPDGPKSDDPLAIAYRKASAGKRKPLTPGATLPLQGVDALVIASSGCPMHPSPDAKPNPLCVASPADLPTDNSDNARGVALRIRAGQFDFLDTADLTWNIEKKLVCPSDLIGPIDLYQVAHHGLDISNHPTLLATIAPTVTVMNNGPNKGGSPATVRRIKALPSVQAAYQLHRNVQSSPADNTDPALIANANPAGGQFIQVRVAADAASFRVRIGTDGAERTFPTR